MAFKQDSKKVGSHLRKCAGKAWHDPTLEEWDPGDIRFFVGDLGPEVTTEMLTEAFSTYKSFKKAKVIFDRKGKSAGYGFVSLSDIEDAVKCIKEMHRSYLGNRPITVTRSKWKDREVDSVRNKYLRLKAPDQGVKKRRFTKAQRLDR